MDRPEDRLALIEVEGPEGRGGRVNRMVDVHAWPLRIGRALSNHLVLDDPHVAPEHARLDDDGAGGVLLTVLDSVNGVGFEGQRLAAGRLTQLTAASGPLQIGATRLRLRLPGETLAPARPLPAPAGIRPSLVWVAGAALLALQWARHWVSLDPGADYSAWLQTLVGLPVGIAAWCALWALLSKLFQHRFDFSGHLHIALPWLLAMACVEVLWPQLGAALAAPGLWQWGSPLLQVMLALLVRAHLVHLLPAHPRGASLAVLAFALAGGTILLALNYRGSDSFKGAPYMSTLPLPALRLGGTVPSATLVQDMAPLAASLAQRVKKARDDEEDEGTEPAGE